MSEHDLSSDIEVDLSLLKHHSIRSNNPSDHIKAYKSTFSELSLRIISSSFDDGGDTAQLRILTDFYGIYGDECAAYFDEKFRDTILAQLRLKSKEISPVTIQEAIKKSLDLLENNFLDVSVKKKYQSAGQCSILGIFGPDQQGNLNIFSSAVGDFSTLICREGQPLLLGDSRATEISDSILTKNLTLEDDFFRLPPKVPLLKGISRSDSEACLKGMAKSVLKYNILGGCHFKKPVERLPRLSSNVAQTSLTLDVEKDLFLVHAPRVFFDLVDSQTIVDVVLEERFNGVESACEALLSRYQIAVDESKKQKPQRQISISVVFFEWHEDVFTPPTAAELEALGYLSHDREESEAGKVEHIEEAIKRDDEGDESCLIADKAIKAELILDEDDDMFKFD
eukprot:GDKJ01036645.1.p1 GENE.GDKJ01036645.1~~GDKJ01036645.1.p1  ORF type:complete len:396 (-),score=75.34 GDKJ01036645.1:58-1245(-)